MAKSTRIESRTMPGKAIITSRVRFNLSINKISNQSKPEALPDLGDHCFYILIYKSSFIKMICEIL